MKLDFELSEPFHPFEQLLAVLPAASASCLPVPFQVIYFYHVQIFFVGFAYLVKLVIFGKFTTCIFIIGTYVRRI